MSLLLHGHRNDQMNQKKWMPLAQELLPIMKKEVEEVFPSEDVTMREVEHWLCEFQKYVKYINMVDTGTKVKHRKYLRMVSDE